MPTKTIASCTFCKVIRGEVPSYFVFEDDVSLAFLDHRPLFPGHCLLVPRDHHETLAALPSDLITPIFTNAQLLARAVEQSMNAEGTFVAMNNRVSQSVPHLHIHVVPRRKKDGLKGFFWPRQPYKNEEEIKKVQNTLRAAITALKVS
ncbi:HIT family protein [candidate division KSB1 bacterium]|nr:HIT family protein [candidate division KSB1 bacterium]